MAIDELQSNWSSLVPLARFRDGDKLADELERVLSKLALCGRRVLEFRLQGALISEIAHDTGRSERTVRRVLGHIREVLAGRLDDA